MMLVFLSFSLEKDMCALAQLHYASVSVLFSLKMVQCMRMADLLAFVGLMKQVCASSSMRV